MIRTGLIIRKLPQPNSSKARLNRPFKGAAIITQDEEGKVRMKVCATVAIARKGIQKTRIFGSNTVYFTVLRRVNKRVSHYRAVFF